MQQEFCHSRPTSLLLWRDEMEKPYETAAEAAEWMKRGRAARGGMSAADLADRAAGAARAEGVPANYSQQLISLFEKGEAKKLPPWLRYVHLAFEAYDEETNREDHTDPAQYDDKVWIEKLPTFAGLGAGGTGDDTRSFVAFSRDLIFNQLRLQPDVLLYMECEGNSMEPDFKGGDQMLVNTGRKSLAQPAAFCIWDGEGHVIKYVEKVPGTEPEMIRLISANDMYEPQLRLREEVNIVGKVVWFGRPVH